MSTKVFLVVYLLCYVYSVLSQLPSDWDEEGRAVNQTYCAALINETVPDYGRSICKADDLYECLVYDDSVTVVTDHISHVNGYSVIHVEINPNATSGEDVFYYVFCLTYNWTLFEWTHFDLLACPSGGLEMDLGHKWRQNGEAWVLVKVFSKSVRRHALGCNYDTIPVAGDFGLELDVDIYDDLHPLPHPQSLFSLPTPTASPGNDTTAHVAGNITFVSKPSVTMPDEELFEYFFTYEFGDNSSIGDSKDFNTTHLYERANNYSYTVKATALNAKDNTKAYFKKYNGTLIIFDPVSNATMNFNHNNSIAVNSKVHLHIACAGSLPISVCWEVHHLNSSQTMPSNTTCICLNSSSLHHEMTFKETGRFEIAATFNNSVSRMNYSYTFHVVTGPKPPIVATTTSVGVVLGIVVAIIVVLVIMAVGGYLPYRRYRSHMIETADFKFVDLSDKKISVWHKFKLKVGKLYAHIRPHRSTDKIGLVNLISGPQYDSQKSSSSSLSYNTF